MAKSASAPSRVAAASRSGSAAAPRRWWRIVGGAILPLLILMFWQIVSMSGLLPAYRLPSPTSVWLAAEDLSQRGLLGQDIVISLQRVWLGFLLGAVLGLIAAAVVGLTRLGDVLLSPTLGALRAVPSLAWLPLLVLYIGINENEKVYLIAIGAFFPVYTTVASALRYVDPQLVELGRAYGLRGTALLGRVQLPAVIPSVVSSLRLALAQSWLFLVAAELLGSSMGLGFLLLDSQNSSRLDRLFLTIILLGIFGKLTDVLIGILERFLLRRWGR